MTVFKAEVTSLGKEMLASIEEKMIILFNDNVKKTASEIADYCVLIKDYELLAQICTGHVLHMSGKQYKVTAVGDVANENLKLLGHCSLCFDGSETSELLGNVHFEDIGVPDVKPGDSILITDK